MTQRFPLLYAIVDASIPQTSDASVAETIAVKLAGAGVELQQYRNKRATSRELFETSNALAAALARFGNGVRFIVNDRADVALLAGAGGVHLGQTDLNVDSVREMAGRKMWIGISTHNLTQLAAADQTSADYIAFGPIFPTTTKENPDPVVGLAGLAEARKRTGKPLVAIGGITLERAAEVYRAGADCLCVVRDLLCAADPAARARAYLEIASRVQREKC